VIAWVKADEAARKAQLEQLLPLIRFPLMGKPALLMMAEPLVAQHPLCDQPASPRIRQPTHCLIYSDIICRAFRMLAETHPNFAESEDAATCPRLRPRTGKPALVFTRAAAAYYAISENGLRVRSEQDPINRVAACTGVVMTVAPNIQASSDFQFSIFTSSSPQPPLNRYGVEFTVVKMDRWDDNGRGTQGAQACGVRLGLSRPDISEDEMGVYKTSQFWGISSRAGHMSHDNVRHAWVGMEGFEPGDVVGLLLDCAAGTLRARSRCRFAPPIFHATPDSLTYSVPLSRKRKCVPNPRHADRQEERGAARGGGHRADGGVLLGAGADQGC
jgi:hypothetical protein